MAKNTPRVGGGIRTNKLVEPKVRTGERGRAINERAVSQVGQSLGNKVQDSRRSINPAETLKGAARPAGGVGGVPLGNEVAGNVGKGGAGTGRTLYGQSGTNKQYGSGGPEKPSGRPILEDFGPTVPGRR
jgi:hypothetical protein